MEIIFTQWSHLQIMIRGQEVIRQCQAVMMGLCGSQKGQE